MMSQHPLLTLVIAALVSMTQAYPGYKKDMPNVDYVINPITKANHSGLGHILDDGSGVRNCFGKDYVKSGRTWSKLCALDSDGDGMTNGQELGDPTCQWTKGTLISHNNITDPGVCTPTNAAMCQHMNAPKTDCVVPTTMMTTTSPTTMMTTTSNGHYIKISGLFWGAVFLMSAMF